MEIYGVLAGVGALAALVTGMAAHLVLVGPVNDQKPKGPGCRPL